MRIKRLATILLFILLIAGQGFADVKHKIDFGPFGDLYHFWIDPSSEFELKFLSSTLAEPQTLYSFTLETTAYDLDVDNTKFYLAYSTQDSKVYLTYSKDNGYTFSAPTLLTDQGSNPSIAGHGDLLSIAWEEEDGIYFSNSLPLVITGEVLSSPSLSIDDLDNTHLVFLSKDINTYLNKIMYTALPTHEPIVLFESYDDLINVGIQSFPSLLPNNAGAETLMVFWQKEYMERRETYFCISLDGGKNFGCAKQLAFDKDLLSITFSNGKLSAVFLEYSAIDTALIIKEIDLPALASPHIIFPFEGAVLNNSDLRLSYVSPGNHPFICKIGVSQENSDPLSFEQLVSPSTQEIVNFNFPVELRDGTYVAKINIFDGANLSPDSQTIQFKIDNIPPQIQSLEAQREEKQLILKGKVSESPAWLTINDHAVPLEASDGGLTPDIYFESEFVLAPGENLFTLVLTDEAGNPGVVTEEVFYDPAVPELTILKPSKDEWFKPDSVILFEVQVCDLQEDIHDGAEAEIWINNQPLADALTYNHEESALFGFIFLPAELTDGTYPGTITLSDKSGNQGEAEFTINIDGSPPLVSYQTQDSCYTNSPNSITFLAEEEGAGIDPSGTLIKVSGISFEGSVSVEAHKIILTSDIPFSEGTYEAEITARDQIGNVGEPTAFRLVVDTTSPELTLVGSYETSTSENKMMIQGKVEDEYACSINIYSNQVKIESFELSTDSFSKEINLFPGSNNILVEVLDRSGNAASANINTFASFSTVSTSLIQNCIHGPNPFSPAKSLPGAFSADGKGMVFSYALLEPADVKIRIYDLTGTLIWTRDISNTASGVTTWSGVDAFGRVAENGIYPYIFQATSGNSTGIKKGKIIIIK